MPQPQSCPFCDIVDGDDAATVLVESERYLCILDAYPVTEGHALAFPKTHFKRLSQVDGAALYRFVETAVDEVVRRYDPDGINIGINDGSAAGQTIPHVHWHIIPRYDGDIDDPTGGVRGVIPEKRVYSTE